MILTYLKPKEYKEGTNYDRLTEYDTVSVADNGLEFFETDTEILYRVCAGAWLAINIGGGVTTFLGLSDTPASYSGAGGQLVAVNGGASGLEFVDLPVHDIVGSSHTITGAAFSVVGATALSTLGLITPTNSPGATERLLKTNSSGNLTIYELNATNSVNLLGSTLYDGTGASGSVGNFLKRRTVGGGQGNSEWADINVTDLNGTGSQYDVIGFTATNIVGILTPASDPGGANEVLLKTNASGNINLQSALTFNVASIISTTAGQLTIDAVGGLVINEIGAAVNFRVESDTQANMLLVDGTNNRIGVMNAAPSYSFHQTSTDTAADTLTYGMFVGHTTTVSAGLTLPHRAMGFQMTLSGSGGAATQDIGGVVGEAHNNQTSGTLAAMAGMQANVRVINAGNVTNSYGLRTVPVLTSTGAITNHYGIDIRTPVKTSSGGIGTAYGLYVAAQNIATTNFSIYTNAGIVRFGGNLGLSVNSPQGQIHGHDGTGGFLQWSNASVGGTAITVIPNGTGDVLYDSFWMYTVRHDGGGTQTGTVAVNPGFDAALFDIAGNTLKLAIAADGTVTVQRTAGTGVYRVTLCGIWL